MPANIQSHGGGGGGGGRDTDMDAWILGTGVPSLTSAVYLITEAKVPPHRVHILEAVGMADGSTVNTGDPVNGYEYRTGVMFPLTDVHLANLLSMVPSEHEAGKTALDDILDYSAMQPVKGLPHTRFLVEKSNGISCVSPKNIGLGLRDHLDMFRFMPKSEKALGRSPIQDHFHKGFFRTNFWCVFASTLGFQPWHSAAEFHRAVDQYMHNMDDLNTPHPLDQGRYNRHETMTAPIARYLISRGVDFRFNTAVTDIIMDPIGACHRVTAIKYEPAKKLGTAQPQPQPQMITLGPNDITIACLGSIVSSAAAGSNMDPPDLEINEPRKDQDENWLLWLELCTKNPKFGDAYNFCTRLSRSRVEAFTVTCRSTRFFDAFTALTGNKPGDAPFVTLKDSSWGLSVSVPRQPLFPNQPADVQVFWGQAMNPDNVGDYVKKAMVKCSGREILVELLRHLRFPVQEILEDSLTVPCVFPRLTATLLTRTPEDRPQVIPENMSNLALIGRFVEYPGETANTAGYAVKSAITAVRHLMGVSDKT